MIYRHEISDQNWELIKGLLPAENSGEGRPSKPNRHMQRDWRNMKNWLMELSEMVESASIR